MEIESSEAVLIKICDAYGISLPQLLSHRRDMTFVTARVECAKKLRAMGLSLPRIGKIMNRDHTTILYLLRDPKAHGVKKAAVDATIAELCRKHGISVDDLRSRSHAHHLVAVRQECAVMLRSAGMDWLSIGRVLNRDPTTILRQLALLRRQKAEAS